MTLDCFSHPTAIQNVTGRHIAARKFPPGRLRHWLFAAVFPVATSAPAAPPDTDPMAGEEAFLAEIPVVMSATRLPQPLLSSPVSTTVITRDLIEASGFNEIADIFRLVPGFQVAHATGGHFVVAYHGQEFTLASRLEVLIDGRSVYGNILSSVQWNTLGIALEDIEKIEVIRGPNAPVFGANAMVATVNIITRQPYAEQGTWLRATAGSLDTREYLLRYSDAAGKLDYRISLGWQQDDGFDSDPDHGTDFDSSRLGMVSFRGSWAPSLQDDIDIHWGFTGGEGATLYPGTEREFSNHDADIDASYQQLRWTRDLQNNEEIYLQLYHNYTRQDDRFDYGPLSEVLGVAPALIPLGFDGRPDQSVKFYYSDGTSERYDLEFQHRLAPVGQQRSVWGAGLRLDRLKSEGHLNRPGFIDNPSARVFGNMEWDVSSRTSLNLGAMLEHNDLIGLFGSARLAANYRLARDHSLRASVSETQRSPSIIEENWDYSIEFDDGTQLHQVLWSAGDLKPERLTAIELGYTFLSRDGGMLFDAKVFHESASELVSNIRTADFPEAYIHDGAEVIVNTDKYRISGLEGAIKWQANERDLLVLQYSLARSRRELNRGGPVEPIKIDHNATPESTASLLFSHHFQNGFSAVLGYYHMSEIKWLGDGDTIEGHDRIDIRLARMFEGDHWDGQLELVAQNVGQRYQEYIREELGRTTFETRYYVKAGLHF